MEIKRFESDMMASNMYLLSENGHAVVIDPCRDTSPGSGLKTDALILTHEHYVISPESMHGKTHTGAP